MSRSRGSYPGLVACTAVDVALNQEALSDKGRLRSKRRSGAEAAAGRLYDSQSLYWFAGGAARENGTERGPCWRALLLVALLRSHACMSSDKPPHPASHDFDQPASENGCLACRPEPVWDCKRRRRLEERDAGINRARKQAARICACARRSPCGFWSNAIVRTAGGNDSACIPCSCYNMTQTRSMGAIPRYQELEM